jgi:hypothetical protein
MRDLASRLRSIVRQDHGGAAPAPVRELTYVPDAGDLSQSPERAAVALGGQVLDTRAGRSGCISIDRVWEPDRSHGLQRVGSFAPAPEAPLSLFDPRAAGAPDWASRVVFFDLETTGLSGGAGTLAFLAGCAWFEDGAFRVRQFFLGAPSGESAMLDALAGIFGDASLLVTFNGRTFDVPLMETRWAYHRASAPTDDLPHFDMLPPARRLWGRRDARPSLDDDAAPVSCSLSSLERSVLGFHRVGDVPGFEIPMRYFHFLRTGDAGAIEGVLEHNRHDLLSLAGVMSRALSLAHEGPVACREAFEQVALGRLYECAGLMDRARQAFESAASNHCGDREARSHALARLAVLLGRQERYDESAAAWKGVLDHARRRGPLTPLERRALEALAIHYEHRARDLAAARIYAERLKADTAGRVRQDAAHRLGRINRKLDARGPSGRRLDWDVE